MSNYMRMTRQKRFNTLVIPGGVPVDDVMLDLIEDLHEQLAARDAEIVSLNGYCRTVDGLRTIATEACNKAWIEIEDLKQQLANYQSEVVRATGEFAECFRRLSECEEALHVEQEANGELEGVVVLLRGILTTYDGSHSIDQWDENIMPTRHWDKRRIEALATTEPTRTKEIGK